VDTSTLALLVTGALLWALWRARELRFVPTLIAVVFGFYLSDSDAAPAIRHGVASLLHWVATWNL
jgi:hypothetical protein